MNGPIAITCPACKKECLERHVRFAEAPEGYPQFNIEHLECGHKWKAHHRDFHRTLVNPFLPLIVPGTKGW
jgi:hypothetical protein